MNLFKISPEAVAQAQCLARLHAEARAQARALRTQAIDDFWRGAQEVLRSAYASTYAVTRRSAQQLGHALARQTARQRARRPSGLNPPSRPNP